VVDAPRAQRGSSDPTPPAEVFHSVGGAVSPILANIFLHEVLDAWFHREVKPRLAGKAVLVRYADDAVFLFANETDARRVMNVLPKRLGKYGLELHPDKTRLVHFRRPDRFVPTGASEGPGTFDLLGFTHYWGKARSGKWIVKRRTAKDRFARGLKRVADWCREHRHDEIRARKEALDEKLRGHFGYYGITGNFEAIKHFRFRVTEVWRKWLDRRSQRASMPWPRMHRLLERKPLPKPRITRPLLPRAASP
jgi:RNA-directed DNA polymerase